MKSWWAIYLFLALLTVLLVMFVLGGQLKVLSWCLTLCLPVLGLAYMLGAIGRAILVRRVTLPIVFCIVIAMVSIVPITWLPLLQLWPKAFPLSIENAQPQLAIRVPTNETMIVTQGGTDPRLNMHAYLPSQRWAYDLIIEPHPVSSKVLTEYGCYGVPVVAPINGKIIVIENDIAESVPGELDITINPYGNHVVIQPEQGGFLVVAHLQPGSISVEAGAEIMEDEVIGLCGNSGNTTAPHIHIHYQKHDPREFILLAQGLPLFFRDHSGAAMPDGGFYVENSTPGKIRHLQRQ